MAGGDKTEHNHAMAVSLVAIAVLAIFGARLFLDGDTNQKNATTSSVIHATHEYVGDRHTLKGTIALPTPCHRLYTRAVPDNLSQTDITIAFNTATVAETCVGDPKEESFLVSFMAPADASIRALFNGTPVEIRLKSAPIFSGQQ